MLAGTYQTVSYFVERFAAGAGAGCTPVPGVGEWLAKTRSATRRELSEGGHRLASL